MRLLWEIFTLIAGIGVIFAIGKGFPAFGHFLRFLLLNPVGWILTAGLIVFIVVIRKRAAANRASRNS